jgi:hypothetical protein
MIQGPGDSLPILRELTKVRGSRQNLFSLSTLTEGKDFVMIIFLSSGDWVGRLGTKTRRETILFRANRSFIYLTDQQEDIERLQMLRKEMLLRLIDG